MEPELVTDELITAWNESVVFTPDDGGDIRPCLTIAGVVVWAYVERADDGSPRLTIGVGAQDADERLLDVPVRRFGHWPS